MILPLVESSNNKFCTVFEKSNSLQCTVLRIPSCFFKGLLDIYEDLKSVDMGKKALIEFSYSLNGTFPRLSSWDIISILLQIILHSELKKPKKCNLRKPYSSTQRTKFSNSSLLSEEIFSKNVDFSMPLRKYIF